MDQNEGQMESRSKGACHALKPKILSGDLPKAKYRTNVNPDTNLLTGTRGS